MIGNHVLAAKFVFDRRERIFDVLHLEGEECATAGGGCEPFQILVAAQDQAAVVRRNGVDNDLGALRHFDRLSQTDVALVVIPITENDERFALWTVGLLFQKLIFASVIDGIVECGASAFAQGSDATGYFRNVIGEILGQIARAVEAHHEGFIESATQYMLHKTGGRVLFEIEARMNRATDVNQQAHLQWQIGLAMEIYDGLHRLMIIEETKIILCKVANEFAVLVGSDEENIHFIYPLANRKNGILWIIGSGRCGKGTRRTDHVG